MLALAMLAGCLGSDWKGEIEVELIEGTVLHCSHISLADNLYPNNGIAMCYRREDYVRFSGRSVVRMTIVPETKR
jgi:hypothetical protein